MNESGKASFLDSLALAFKRKDNARTNLFDDKNMPEKVKKSKIVSLEDGVNC